MSFKKYVNNLILKQASKLNYRVSSNAPGTFKDLYNSTSLVIWDGASDNSWFQDASVNYAFRALHDTLHLKTMIGFTPKEEIELGRVQANQYTGLMADLVYSQVAGQAEYYLNNGIFVPNEVEFTSNQLNLGATV